MASFLYKRHDDHIAVADWNTVENGRKTGGFPHQPLDISTDWCGGVIESANDQWEQASMLVSEPWTIDRLAIDRKADTVVVDMNGWAFPDPDLGPKSPGTFLLDGKPFADVSYPVDREEVGAIFWQRPNARYSGFRCVASAPYDDFS